MVARGNNSPFADHLLHLKKKLAAKYSIETYSSIFLPTARAFVEKLINFQTGATVTYVEIRPESPFELNFQWDVVHRTTPCMAE